MAESNWSTRHSSGTEIEDADVWMRQFINCCEYKEYGKLALIKVLLTGVAETWLESLTAAQTDTWQHLHGVFKTRYTAPSFMKFKSAKDLRPNSIRSILSEFVRNLSLTCLRLVRNLLKTCSKPDAVL